jgi:hypothetical protein
MSRKEPNKKHESKKTEQKRHNSVQNPDYGSAYMSEHVGCSRYWATVNKKSDAAFVATKIRKLVKY